MAIRASGTQVEGNKNIPEKKKSDKNSHRAGTEEANRYQTCNCHHDLDYCQPGASGNQRPNGRAHNFCA